LEAFREQHEVMCKRSKAKKVILHTILLGMGGSIHTSHTLNHLKKLGLDTQKAHKTALELHAHSVPCADKLTRRTLENSQGPSLEQGAACLPKDPQWFFLFSGGGTHGSLGQCNIIDILMLLASGVEVQLVVTICVSLGVLMWSGLFPIYCIISFSL